MAAIEQNLLFSAILIVFIDSGNVLQLRMGDHWVPYHPNFRFFMTTKLPNPHYAPEVSTKTTIINCAIKEEGEMFHSFTFNIEVFKIAL